MYARYILYYHLASAQIFLHHRRQQSSHIICAPSPLNTRYHMYDSPSPTLTVTTASEQTTHPSASLHHLEATGVMRSTSHNGGIWITSYFRLLSVAILGGASSQRPQRDVPVVGIGPLAPVAGTVRRSSAFSGVSYQSATGVAIEDELIRGLETDDQVTGKMWRVVI